jgi:two-component system sensor histidine kinase UhpB
MRERILALGGTLAVVSDDGGVTVEALIPRDIRG